MEMTRVSENELQRILKHFNNKGIYVYTKGVISGRNTIHKAKCKYNKETGLIDIYDILSQDNITINTVMAYEFLLSEDKRILKIKLDNEEEVRIEL